MRKITQDAIASFNNHKNFKRDNTEVRISSEGKIIELLLHNHVIAGKSLGILSITNAGWFTNTTKERLNGLPKVHVIQRAGQWYLNGNLWDGTWIEIV
jgi:hypothetical protein